MEYNVKKAVENIDLYMQRHKKAEPMNMQDKQVVARHILPLITPHKQVPHVDTVAQPEAKTSKPVKKAKKAAKKSKPSEEKQKPEEMGENLLD